MKQKRIAIIGCKTKKKDHPCIASVMYGDAPGFKHQIPFIEQYYSDYRIFSLKYGLLEPTDHIEPYDLTLSKSPYIKAAPRIDDESLERLVTKVLKQVAQLTTQYNHIDLHLSTPYMEPLEAVGIFQIPNVRWVPQPTMMHTGTNYKRVVKEFETNPNVNLDIISKFSKWRKEFKNETFNKKTILPWKQNNTK